METIQISNWVVRRFEILNPNTSGIIWFGDYPNLKLGGPTVWNPESKHVGGQFGLETIQISNWVVQQSGILNPNTSVIIWFGDYPNLKLGGPTVWNLESKHVEGNLVV